MTMTGQCRCAAVRYTLTLPDTPPVYACHCLHCQRWSGSAFGLHLLAPEAALSITGPVDHYHHEHEGVQSRQTLCAHCHTRIFNHTSAAPGMVVVRAGTLDEAPRLTPAAHIWTSRKHDWIAIPDDVPSWPQSPSPEAFAAVVLNA